MVVSEKWEHIDVSKKFGTEITITESTLDEIVEAHQVVDDESLTEVGYCYESLIKQYPVTIEEAYQLKHK